MMIWWCNCKAMRSNTRRVLAFTLCILFYYGIWFTGSCYWTDSATTEKALVFKRGFHYNPCSHTGSGYFLSRCVNQISPDVSILTAECPSRLGNQMFSYAILFAISTYNNKIPAYMSPLMSNYLSKYFKVSLSTLDKSLYDSTSWNLQLLGAKVPKTIRNLTAISSPGSKIKFCCYPQSYKYFDEIRPQILQEFRFFDTIERRAQTELSNALEEFYPESASGTTTTEQDVTFIGVHIRRTDYLSEVKRITFYLPSVDYYEGAMEYFKAKFKNPIFIVASDDISWCQTHFAHLGQQYLLHYLNGTSQEDGGLDMAVLSSCDHVIFGLGTFGFWTGYLSPGEVVYCSDCITNDSLWMKDPAVYGGDYANFVLPSWKGMSRNGSKVKS